MNKYTSVNRPPLFACNEAEIIQQPCAYILVNHDNGATYAGVTTCLVEQVWKHKANMIEGFSSKFDIHTLVWYEYHDTIEAAYLQAKHLKNASFEVKQKLVESSNPKWRDLYDELCAEQRALEQKTA